MRPNPFATGEQNALRPTCVQSLTLALQGNAPPTVTGAPLVLPVYLMFDVVPPDVATTELQFSVQELQTFVGEYFRMTQ